MFISLYVLKLPYFIGLIIIFLGICFYFSQHRSFTHSIFGILTLSASVSLILIWSYQLLVNVTVLDNDYMIMAILIALIIFLFLNKRVLLIFLPLFFLSLFIFPDMGINIIEIPLSLALGLFSHTVLDAFTPSGIKLFAPLSDKKVYKNFALASVFILIIMAIVIHIPILFSFFNVYVS